MRAFPYSDADVRAPGTGPRRRPRRSALVPARGPLPVVLFLVASAAWGPAPAAGQMSFVLASHVGSSPAAPGGLMLDGATELRQGVWGMRFGVGLDASGTALAPLAAGGEPSGVWNSDLDAGLNVGRIPYVGTLFGAADPAAFMGAGVAGVSSTEPTTGERSSSLVPTWSYGARAGLPFASWLRLEVEARHRSTVGTVSPEAYPASQGWEYRAGLALRFGGAASARTVSAPRGEAAERRTSVGSGDVARGASAAEVADRTVLTAQRYIGTPYRWGGTSPRQGFDCSGFVQYVYREQGIELPRVARDQARAGQRLPTRLDGLATGDLLFFARGGPTVDHVAIYAGDGRIVHSSSSGRGVRYDELTGDRGRWYVQHLVAVRRVIPEDGVTPGALPARETTPMPRRELPLDEAFEAITSERGDAAPPPSR